MLTQADSFIDQIRKWVVNDYFTPNIKAEVILDTLLTPYIPQILKDQLNIDAVLLAKEMSIPDEGEQFGSIGPKVDYVLAGSDQVYLVELKTTNSSFDGDQAKNYLKNCQGEPFGKKLGRQLLSILAKPKQGTFNINLDKWGDPASWGRRGDEVIGEVFQAIITKPFDLYSLPPEAKDRKNEGRIQCARELILKNKWTQRKKYRSRKYLYTLGQLANYLDENGNTLWEKPMEVIYLTPYGGDITVEGMVFPGAGLVDAGNALAEKQEDALAQLLADIINEIYGG